MTQGGKPAPACGRLSYSTSRSRRIETGGNNNYPTGSQRQIGKQRDLGSGTVGLGTDRKASQQMKLISRKIHVSTQGNSEIINLTNTVTQYLKDTDFNSGLVHLFIPGATGALTTIEYEPGLIDDLRQTFQHIAPEEAEYSHNKTHKDSNAHSHIRASLIGPSLSIPFENTALQLGKWQQIVFIDFDNRPREREIILQMLAET